MTITNALGMTVEEEEMAQALAVAVSDHLQDVIAGYFQRTHFTGGHDAILNGALHAVCSAADSARQAVGTDALDLPLPEIVAERAAFFFSELNAERVIGEPQGRA